MTAPSLNSMYDKAKGKEEHILALPGGRQLAYAHNGPPTSKTIILFFSGIMGVGTAPDVPAPCRAIDAHWIAPTLPGMGNSSARADTGEPYHVALARDITALLAHLYPSGGDSYEAIYIAGGSYGTVQAQMLYGAPYDLFPPGRKVVGCIVLAGFSPFKYNTGYTRSLNWQNWFSVGPPSQLIPFHLGQRLMSTVIASKLKTLDGAQALLHSILYSKMGEEEKKTFSGWLETQDRTEEEFFGDMASGAMRSSTNWAAFLEVSDVLHSDWGFNPAELDDDHASKPMLVVGSEQDHLGGSTNEWIAENYRAAKLKVVPGGHISSLWHMDEIWREMIDMVNSK